MSSTVIRRASELPDGPLSVWAEPVAGPTGVLVCPPDEFDVIDVKNPHMARSVGAVDRAVAREQWGRLIEAFQRIGLPARRVERSGTTP